MPINLLTPPLPPALAGIASIGPFGLPRYWASIWSDLLNASWEASTRRKHLAALDRLYETVRRQRGSECLDRLLANADAQALEECLMGFLVQLRNEAVVDGVDRAATWTSAVMFVSDILRHAGTPSGAQAADLQARLLRIEALSGQLVPNSAKPQPPIRALPPLVVEDLYEIFSPDSPRNPFRTTAARWRNLLIFMLLLRLGLRRGEAALLLVNSFKEDFDPVAGKMIPWLDVEETGDADPRYEQPSLKTGASRRQLPIQRELVELVHVYSSNYRGRANRPHLLISQKGRPLSLRALSEIFETATRALSDAARKSLAKQGLQSVSCHDLRHTAAVVRMTRYQEGGDDLDRAQEKLRVYFGWAKDSQMPRLYAKAYFETALSEVWNEKFDQFVDSLRRSMPEDRS